MCVGCNVVDLVVVVDVTLERLPPVVGGMFSKSVKGWLGISGGGGLVVSGSLSLAESDFFSKFLSKVFLRRLFTLLGID